MKKVTALVVDDSRIMRNMVKNTLSRTSLAQFEFIEAEDGENALHVFNSNSAIDIVFADWNMPKMNGIDLVRKIRSSKKNTDIPLVMVTSERTIGKMNEALDSAGADAFICKPFTVIDLERKLGKIIEQIPEKSDKKPQSGFFGKLLGSN